MKTVRFSSPLSAHSELPSKRLVRQNFERAASTYNSAARVQRWVSSRLISLLPSTLIPAIILDAGCGTGFSLEMLALRFPAARCIALDFSRAMLAHIRQLEFGVCGDVEHIPLRGEVAGLYWSNLTAQWCNSSALSREAWRVLWPKGTLALSSLAPGTFHELDETFAQVDAYAHTLPFQTPENWRAALSDAGFSDIRIHAEPCVAHYRDLRSLVKAIKAIGANQIAPSSRRPGLIGRKTWQKLEAAYEARRDARGLPLTYQVIFCTAKK
ncbi:MAG: malonyl-ACP O-methyltransferase BioC [Zoogloeaceae bacterium]|jgi:malonyl-CoA O-methyltransferase|nr:malonyl-ACP O-methyltransferase BioC [Zoogloeaceae bacterium]